jgi:hypothetical protein
MPGNDDEVKSTAPRVKLTYEDILLFPDDGKRDELIDGEHYVTGHRISGTRLRSVTSISA